MVWKKKKDEKKKPEEPEGPEVHFGEQGIEIEDLFKSAFDEDFSKVMQRMMHDMQRAFSQQPMRQTGKPLVYGFSLKTGPEGKLKIEEFGNVEPGKKPVIRSEREPLVDVMDKEKVITVLAELPGVEKKEIDVQVAGDDDIVVIDVPDKFYKEIKLPAEVKKEAKAHYKNGVLEVELEKKKPSKKKKAGKIQVE